MHRFLIQNNQVSKLVCSILQMILLLIFSHVLELMSSDISGLLSGAAELFISVYDWTYAEISVTLVRQKLYKDH